MGSRPQIFDELSISISCRVEEELHCPCPCEGPGFMILIVYMLEATMDRAQQVGNPSSQYLEILSAECSFIAFLSHVFQYADLD